MGWLGKSWASQDHGLWVWVVGWEVWIAMKCLLLAQFLQTLQPVSNCNRGHCPATYFNQKLNTIHTPHNPLRDAALARIHQTTYKEQSLQTRFDLAHTTENLPNSFNFPPPRRTKHRIQIHLLICAKNWRKRIWYEAREFTGSKFRSEDYKF